VRSDFHSKWRLLARAAVADPFDPGPRMALSDHLREASKAFLPDYLREAGEWLTCIQGNLYWRFGPHSWQYWFVADRIASPFVTCARCRKAKSVRMHPEVGWLCVACRSQIWNDPRPDPFIAYLEAL
jgi:hypothetical protein